MTAPDPIPQRDVPPMRFGTGSLRRRWPIVALCGALWFLLGLGFIVESRPGDALLHPGCLVAACVVDGLLSLAAAGMLASASRGLDLAKAGVAFAVGAVIVTAAEHADMLTGILIGGFFIADAIRRGIAAVTLRLDGWRLAIVTVAAEILVGLWALLSYALQGQGKVSFDVGLLLTHSAVGLCVFAWQLRRVPVRSERIAG